METLEKINSQEHKCVNNEYIKNKITKKEYKRTLVNKIGGVQARPINDGEIITIYYYNHKAEIEESPIKIVGNDSVLIIKHIGGKQYNSIMNSIAFHKHYFWNSRDNEYSPVIDPFTAYVIDEHVCFTNMYKQEVTLNPGDLIVPYDMYEYKKIYSIYRYNFDDNYAFVKPYPTYQGKELVTIDDDGYY